VLERRLDTDAVAKGLEVRMGAHAGDEVVAEVTKVREGGRQARFDLHRAEVQDAGAGAALEGRCDGFSPLRRHGEVAGTGGGKAREAAR
jgi:hypothetical protein